MKEWTLNGLITALLDLMEEHGGNTMVLMGSEPIDKIEYVPTCVCPVNATDITPAYIDIVPR